MDFNIDGMGTCEMKCFDNLRARCVIKLSNDDSSIERCSDESLFVEKASVINAESMMSERIHQSPVFTTCVDQNRMISPGAYDICFY
jgi:hypothetical protein